MFSTLTKSLRRKVQPDISSPGSLTRTITFPESDERGTASHRRSLFHQRDSNTQTPPRNADDEATSDDGNEMEEEGEEEEDSASSSAEDAPLLPIFSSDHLNALPVFIMTHTFREMILDRCDTVLNWEQLRSPQVSQFLVKPIQQEIKDNHFNAATQCALIANALQFGKEASMSPGNSGTNKTRAMLCELIAIRLIREHTTRELIDALSYDFDPLQGQSQTDTQTNALHQRRTFSRPARISCIEIAIRASAKRYLAHPLVIQHLQAIWNGIIVLHHKEDHLHRNLRRVDTMHAYGTTGRQSITSQQASSSNRVATLYNPREASLFKLSRLRVPRYRNILSTISFAILLLLFVAVLEDKSLYITPLELVFWVWAGGYMLDEVIGFNEQGFSLYIASFWNTFDVGILLLLFIHLCLRLYGVILPVDHDSKRYVAKMSYDILATTSVLLFPRLFSVLDHYRYFSQLIIAFRMMAADMVAIFLLIIIFCSGFLVALTFAFSKGSQTDSPAAVAYALLQMLLGFTPAAWDRWDEYNWLGKTVLVLFLFVCHFVIVTILITVMTNSFMEVVRNANEEHQFLFAINVMSSVKSDSLFAYVPPLNVLQWVVTPTRYILPFRDYLKVNRTIIKITHLPILWTIYLYERLVLRPRYVDRTDLVQGRGRRKSTFTKRLPRLMREPSIATFRQEAALEEVFKKTSLRDTRSLERRKSSNVVDSWMYQVDDEEPPQEQDSKIVDRLEKRRPLLRRHLPKQVRDFSVSRRPTSIASDPNDMTSYADFFSPRGRIIPPATDLTPSAVDLPSQQADDDGDDELMTNDHDENDETNVAATTSSRILLGSSGRGMQSKEYFAGRGNSQTQPSDHHDSPDSRRLRYAGALPRPAGKREPGPQHVRNVSSATMIYNPSAESESDEPSPQVTVAASPKRGSLKATDAISQSPSSKPLTHPSGYKTPRKGQQPPHLRPMLLSKDNAAFRSTPNMNKLLARPQPTAISGGSPNRPRRSSLEMDLVSDIGDNKAIGGGYVGALPASFASQMAFATKTMRDTQQQMKQEEDKRRNENSEMFGRLMMARMNTLEEGFREVVHEVRESMKQVGSGLASRQRSPDRDGNLQIQKRTTKRFKERQERSTLTSGAASIVSTERDPDRPKTAGSPEASAGSSGYVDVRKVDEIAERGGPAQAPDTQADVTKSSAKQLGQPGVQDEQHGDGPQATLNKGQQL